MKEGGHVVVLHEGKMKSRERRELFCTDCKYHDVQEKFGEHIECPSCKSMTVVDYKLWLKYGSSQVPTGEGSQA